MNATAGHLAREAAEVLRHHGLHQLADAVQRQTEQLDQARVILFKVDVAAEAALDRRRGVGSALKEIRAAVAEVIP